MKSAPRPEIRTKFAGRPVYPGLPTARASKPQGLLAAQHDQRGFALLFKRVLDLAIAIPGMALLSPFLIVVAAWIKLDSPGPVFYVQNRLGKHGKTFRMVKLRTMYVNADQVLEQRLSEDEALRKEWLTFQKLQNDPRVTRAGSVLRRYSIDELPQLWNICAGDMSVVGPRPLMTHQKEMYGQAIHEIARVMPGITGLWQTSGRNTIPIAQRVELDRQYATHWSIWLDLSILLRSVWVVLRGEGAG